MSPLGSARNGRPISLSDPTIDAQGSAPIASPSRMRKERSSKSWPLRGRPLPGMRSKRPGPSPSSPTSRATRCGPTSTCRSWRCMRVSRSRSCRSGMRMGKHGAPLQLMFSDKIATHSKVQTIYAGDDGVLRRHDYAVEIAADSPAAHYLGNYVTVDGIKFPTERRVYVAGPDGKPMPDLMTVTVDLSNYRFV